MRPEPAVADSHEEDTDGDAKEIERPWETPEGKSPLGDSGSKPEAENPDQLPGEEIEGSGLLHGDAKVGGFDDEIMDPGSQTELGEEPDDSACNENRTPAPSRGEDEQRRSGEHEDDIDGKNIEQRRAVDQQQRRDDGREGMCEVIVQQIE